MTTRQKPSQRIKQPPNYAAALADVVLHRLRPGRTGVARIFHDSDCQHWKGGPCDCRPDITVTED